MTPHATTGRASAELLLGHQPRSVLDLLHPNTRLQVRLNQERQKIRHDQGTVQRQLQDNDTVRVCDIGPGNNKWSKGKIVKIMAPLPYQVQLEEGQIVKRHIDHLRKIPTSPIPFPPSDQPNHVWDEIPLSNSSSTNLQAQQVAPVSAADPVLRRSTRSR